MQRVAYLTCFSAALLPATIFGQTLVEEPSSGGSTPSADQAVGPLIEDLETGPGAPQFGVLPTIAPRPLFPFAQQELGALRSGGDTGAIIFGEGDGTLPPFTQLGPTVPQSSPAGSRRLGPFPFFRSRSGQSSPIGGAMQPGSRLGTPRSWATAASTSPRLSDEGAIWSSPLFSLSRTGDERTSSESSIEQTIARLPRSGDEAADGERSEERGDMPDSESRLSANRDLAQRYAQRADEYLRNGEFYRAVSQYELAISADRANPALLLRQGHAYLGAGEYFRAVRRITQAIELSPDLVRSGISLPDILRGGSLLAQRRSDLTDRLRRDEDFRLRFLLGYLEYFAGDQVVGREHLHRAAAAAPDGSLIARFPAMLDEAYPSRDRQEAVSSSHPTP